MNCRSNSTCDEHRWVVQVRQSLDEDLEEDDEVPVCIFNVPKSLMSSDPDSYTPQQVAIGPYHYWRPELHDMERHKLAAAKRARKNLKTLKFQDLVDQLIQVEPRIRGSYHKYLDFNGETLAWMMAIDASFLLEFLQMYGTRIGKNIHYRKSAHNMIMRDIVMLENQIPLFVLRKVMELQCSSSSDDSLLPLLLGLCQELSPFKKGENLPPIHQISELAHLLDFLYKTVAPANPPQHNENDSEIDQEQEEQEQEQEQSSRILRLMKLKLDLVQRILTSKPAKLVARLPWTVISNLPIFAILKQPVESLILTRDQYQDQQQSNPPSVEEITIPSVSELWSSGVTFTPTNGNISSITFHADTSSLHLPIITLDSHTEVVLRNLVAYEASNSSGPLVLARYTELMNGIIDTEEDVRVLRERGIVVNRMRSDGEVAEMWNGMGRCVRLTKVGFLDKVIGDVNEYYDRRWRIRFGRFVKVYVFRSWRSLTLAAAVLLLFLVSVQTFCSVFRYDRDVRMNK